MDNFIYRWRRQFQSTLPRGERLLHIISMSHLHYFNPRSREGSDRIFMCYYHLYSAFQSTLPRGERRLAIQLKRMTDQFQSTLPRGERHFLLSSAGAFSIISIHAPARGATPFCFVLAPRCAISIHAPARGATKFVRHLCLIPYISIHAPARGATVLDARQGKVLKISIHAPARGATSALLTSVIIPTFQSTLPRGERPFCRLYCRYTAYFNPRSREGSDAAMRSQVR